jgi:hypothetical protein
MIEVVKYFICSLFVIFFLCGCIFKTSVTKNKEVQKIELNGKSTDVTFIIDLDKSNRFSMKSEGSYGNLYFQQNWETIMAFEFAGVKNNTGNFIEFDTRLRGNSQQSDLREDADITICVTLDQKDKQYIVNLRELPSVYEELAYKTLYFPMNIEESVIDSYFNNLDRQRGRGMGQIGLERYLGSWVYFFSNYLFWIYAVLFGWLAVGRGTSAFTRHAFYTVVLYFTFKIELAPASAFAIPYYICTPMLYIPIIRNRLISPLMTFGTIASMILLGFGLWEYQNFFPWAGYMICWAVVGYIGCLLFHSDLLERCLYCGHFAVSWKGRTNRYEKALMHFNTLKEDGSDIEGIGDTAFNTIIYKKQRCGHCMRINDGEL